MYKINQIKDTIIQGDIIQELQKFPSDCIDLVITSPPYNCGISYGDYKDNLPWQDYLNWAEQWLKEIKRVLKEDGRFCLNVLLEMRLENNRNRVSPFAEFYHLLKKVGLNLFGTAIWTDPHRTKLSAWGSWKSATNPYIYCPFEAIIITYKKYWKKQKRGKSTISAEEFIKGCSGIWKLKTETQPLTPSAFHTDLPDMCIKLLSYEGDLVLDPFMGSGTTAVSCQRLKRHFIGIEINKQYCQIAKKRLAQKSLWQ